MFPSWMTDQDYQASETMSPGLGDFLPEPTSELYSPEERFAKQGMTRFLRRLWINLTHMRRPLPLLPARDQVDRIVAVHPGSMKELVFAEPALRALRLRFSQVERVLYANKEAKSLFAGSGWGEIKPLEQLNEERQRRDLICMIVDFTFSTEFDIAKQVRRTGFSHRVGVNLGGRGAFYNIPAQPAMLNDHMVDYYLQLVELIGAIPVGRVPSMPHGLDRSERGRKFWHKHELQKPIVMVPGWNGQSFGWPADVFTAIGRHLSDHELVVLTQDANDSLSKSIAESLGCRLLKNLRTQSLMDALATSALVIGNDNGSLHLAAAMNRPTIALTVTPHPWRTWPRVNVDSAVFRGQGIDSAKVRFDRIPISDLAAAALKLMETDPQEREEEVLPLTKPSTSRSLPSGIR